MPSPFSRSGIRQLHFRSRRLIFLAHYWTKVWFTSVESFAKVLSDRNRTLMELIRAHNPESGGARRAFRQKEIQSLPYAQDNGALRPCFFERRTTRKRYSLCVIYAHRAESKSGTGQRHDCEIVVRESCLIPMSAA